MKNNDPNHPPTNRSERQQYAYSIEEASTLFSQAGTPRSPRTIIRYCARGHLDCIKADTEHNEKYLITRESIDRRIREIQQVAPSRQVPTSRDATGHVSSNHDTTRQDELQPLQEAKTGLEKKVQSLESELLDLRITNRAKDHFLQQLKSERALFLDQITKQSRQIGQLETRLSLESGRSAPHSRAEPAELDPPSAQPTGT